MCFHAVMTALPVDVMVQYGHSSPFPIRRFRTGNGPGRTWII